MKKRFLTAMVLILALSMSMTAVLSGCGCDSKTETSADEATKPTSVVTGTQIATDEQDNTHIEEATKVVEIKADNSKSESEKAESSKPDSKKNDKKNSSAENGSPSGKTNNNNSSSSNSSSSVTSSNNTSSKNDSTSDKQNNASSNKNDGKTWHEAVYKTVTHPAETKRVWVVDKAAYTYDEPVYKTIQSMICSEHSCGADLTDLSQEEISAHMKSHALKGENAGWHSGTKKVLVGTNTVEVPEQGHYETKVVKEAWTEKVLVKEAGYY